MGNKLRGQILGTWITYSNFKSSERRSNRPGRKALPLYRGFCRVPLTRYQHAITNFRTCRCLGRGVKRSVYCGPVRIVPPPTVEKLIPLTHYREQGLHLNRLAKNRPSNLHGIPSALNGFKKQVFTQALTGKGGPSTGLGATYYDFFGPGIQKSLQVQQTAINTVITNVGNMLVTIRGGLSVQTYYSAYAKDRYQGAIDFLSTWTERLFVRSEFNDHNTTVTTCDDDYFHETNGSSADSARIGATRPWTHRLLVMRIRRF